MLKIENLSTVLDTDSGLVRAVEDSLAGLEDSISAIKGLRAGRLRLGVVSTGKYFAPQLIAAFRDQLPTIEINLFIGNRAEIIAKLRDHEVDIALMGRPPRDFEVRAEVFGDHPLVFIAPPAHPLAGALEITRERIAEEQFLLREKGSGTRISLEIFLGDTPRKLEELGTEMGSNETIKQAVMADLGVAFAGTLGYEIRQDRMEPLSWDLFQKGVQLPSTKYLGSLTRLQPISRELIGWWPDIDVLLTPGLGQRPVPIGTINPQKEDDPFTALIPDSSDFTPYTAVWNVTGQPAISLPLLQGDDGLPTSIQLVGPPIGEELLLSLASQIEAERAWADRRPELVGGVA